MDKKTTSEFIAKCSLKHGDKYDYSLVNYINLKTKIKIICPEHGEFEQRPDVHLKGVGCKKCYFKNKIDTVNLCNLFILNANNKFNYYYDYSLVKYQKHNISIDIVCPKHGVFNQRPDVHLKGVGCIECYKENTLSNSKKSFLSQSKLIEMLTFAFSICAKNLIAMW